MPLDDEDRKEIANMVKAGMESDEAGKAIAKTVRQVVPGIVQAATKDVISKVTGLEGTLTGIAEKLDVVEPDPDGDKNKGKESPEVATLRKQVAKLTKDADTAKTERERESARTKLAKIESQFEQAANKLNMRGSGQARAFLMDRLGLDDDGNVVVTVKEDGVEESKPLGEFLEKDFLTSDTGKLHAPAKDVGGTGSRGRGDTTPGHKEDKKGALLDELFGV